MYVIVILAIHGHHGTKKQQNPSKVACPCLNYTSLHVNKTKTVNVQSHIISQKVELCFLTW